MHDSSKLSQESDLPKISRPATRALTEVGIYRLEQLTKVTEADISKLHGMGPKGIRILNEALQAKGLSFAAKK